MAEPNSGLDSLTCLYKAELNDNHSQSTRYKALLAHREFLEVNLQELSAELADIKAQLENEKTLHAGVASDLNEVRAGYSSLSYLYKDLLNDHNWQTTRYKAVLTHRDLLETSILKLKADLAMHNNQLKDTEARLQDEKSSHADVVSDLREVNAGLDSLSFLYRNSLTDQAAQHRNYAALLSHRDLLEMELARLHTTNNLQSRNLNQATIQLQRLGETNTALKTELREARDGLDLISFAHKDMLHEKHWETVKHQALLKHRDLLEAEIVNLKNVGNLQAISIQQATIEIQRLHQRHTVVTAELSEARDGLDFVSVLHKGVLREQHWSSIKQQALFKHRECLETELQQNRDALDGKSTLCEELGQSSEEALKQVASLQQDIQRYTAAKHAQDERFADLENKNRDLGNQLSHTQTALKQLESFRHQISQSVMGHHSYRQADSTADPDGRLVLAVQELRDKRKQLCTRVESLETEVNIAVMGVESLTTYLDQRIDMSAMANAESRMTEMSTALRRWPMQAFAPRRQCKLGTHSTGHVKVRECLERLARLYMTPPRPPRFADIKLCKCSFETATNFEQQLVVRVVLTMLNAVAAAEVTIKLDTSTVMMVLQAFAWLGTIFIDRSLLVKLFAKANRPLVGLSDRLSAV